MSRGVSPTSIVLALAAGLASAACSSSSGGTGGTAGAGGADVVMLRVAHLAPELPTPASTFVDFDVSGLGSFNSFDYGRVSAYSVVAPGLRVVGVTPAGASTELLARITPRLEAGGVYTVIAHRDPGESSAMNLMLIEESLEGFGVDRGGLVVGHGVDDGSWPAMNVLDDGSDTVRVADLPFGGASDPVDLDGGEHALRFESSSPPPSVVEGPFRIRIETAEVALVFVADEDTADNSIAAAVYLIDANTTGLIEPLMPE